MLGSLSLVKELLQNRSLGPVDENAENLYFGRPLQAAATWGHLLITEYLLESGADPSIYEDDRDWKPDQ